MRDSQWDEFTGIVRRVYFTNERLHFQVAAGPEKIVVEVADGENIKQVSLPPVDAFERVRGVVCPVFNNRKQLLGASVYVPDLSFVQNPHSAVLRSLRIADGELR